ncbi:tRNA lysidine(34) synthetase TilS [bacterium]|nr:tRNA lysidine(34) synthetase TilS [bacterium]
MNAATHFRSQLQAGLQRTGAEQARILVAVSGGPDSVALLRGLLDLRDDCGLQLIVTHFNHRFRGEDSEQDARFVAALAEQNQLPCIQGQADHAATVVREESARQVRYQFLEVVANEHQATHIATGHTRDDLVETVLHHLYRGTGLTGLRGMPWERQTPPARIIRPMLAISRETVIGYLGAIDQDYRQDASNGDITLTRNWLRRELLPHIRERFPRVDEAIARLAMQAGETAALTQWIGQQVVAAAIESQTPQAVELSVTILTEYPRAAIREALVQLWIDQGWPRQEMGYDRWNELADLAFSITGCLTLPGAIEARRSGPWLRLRQL